ncbi:TRIM71 [Mytilus coruscus]|uniref:TRIM71 n=1 Tax=Mytilus coruscus TaxID=42192 RepID=A0A6J8BHK4_MYTCO|nr:TRIM71 [Mytilus coruscus]
MEFSKEQNFQPPCTNAIIMPFYWCVTESGLRSYIGTIDIASPTCADAIFVLENSESELQAIKYITSTSNGNICVVDTFDRDFHGRVVILSPGGDILGTYTGHPDVNTKKKPFKAFEVLTTPSDNIVVTDTDNHLLHILNDQGQCITYYNLHDMGILRPHSLALSTKGTIYIGCLKKKALFVISDKKAKLYELEYSGF